MCYAVPSVSMLHPHPDRVATSIIFFFTSSSCHSVISHSIHMISHTRTADSFFLCLIFFFFYALIQAFALFYVRVCCLCCAILAIVTGCLSTFLVITLICVPDLNQHFATTR